MDGAAAILHDERTGAAPDGSQAATDIAALAWRAAALLAIDPIGLGGAVLRAGHGPQRAAWQTALTGCLPDWRNRRLTAGSMAGGDLFGDTLDVATTLQQGRVVRQRSWLNEPEECLLTIAMAERLDASAAAALAAAREAGCGPKLWIALDEAEAGEPGVSPRLADRLAFHLDLSALPVSLCSAAPVLATRDRDQARTCLARYAHEADPAGVVDTVVVLAARMGIGDPRAFAFTLRAARANAALEGRVRVEDDDLAVGAQLVLAPRALFWAEDEVPEETPEQTPPRSEDPPAEEREQTSEDCAEDYEQQFGEPDAERFLEAVLARLPDDLLASLAARQTRSLHSGGGQAPRSTVSRRRGRPLGVRRGDPRRGERLAVLDTIRAAVPFQAMRRRERQAAGSSRLLLCADDLRTRRFQERAESCVIFLADASGSTAFERLGEAKGAVELMLGEAYRQRGEVALIAFRGSEAELLLAPTRSLTRAKRMLAVLPGGGGTPLASAIQAGHRLAESAERRGRAVTLVFLTDGKANIALDGRPGRPAARADAVRAAKRLAVEGHSALVIDTGRRPSQEAETLAQALAARYLALPRAGAQALSVAVKGVSSA
ncbi:MAG: VWA domain-containing protein [Pseudomonadota bacterium]